MVETPPDLSGELFAGGIRQSFHVIEVAMVELVVNGLKGVLDISEIHDPAGGRRWCALHVDFDPERMAVQSAAFVPVRTFGRTWADSRVNSLKISISRLL
jgi:hypothetical protein